MFRRNAQQNPFYRTAIAVALALSVTAVFAVLVDAVTSMQSYL